MKQALKELFGKKVTFGKSHFDVATRGLSLSFNPNQPRDEKGQWELVTGLKYSDSDDDYYYHVTPKPDTIIEKGLAPGAGKPSMAEGFYRGYSRGKVFITERSKAKWWADRIGEHLEAQTDDEPPELHTVRIPKKHVTDIEPDDIGNRDTFGKQNFYSTKRIGGPSEPTEEELMAYYDSQEDEGLSLSNPNWDSQPRDSAGQWTEGGGGGGGDSKGGGDNSGGNKEAPTTAPAAPSAPSGGAPAAGTPKEAKEAIKDVKAIAKSVGMTPDELIGKKFAPGTLDAYGHDVDEETLTAKGILTKLSDGNFELSAQVLEHLGNQKALRESFKTGKPLEQSKKEGKPKQTQAEHLAELTKAEQARYPTAKEQAGALKAYIDQQKQYHPTATGANYDGKHITSASIPAAYTGYSEAELVKSGAIKEVGETDEGWKVYEIALSNVDNEARDSGGQWTAGGASTYQQGKQARAGAYQAQQKAKKQAYVATRMLHDSRTAPGLVNAGNIDLTRRPQVRNADGSVSTVRSMSVNIGGKEVLIPTVSAIQNRVLTDDEAVAEYQQTGQHLGVFNSPQAATQYAARLHQQQEQYYQ